MNTNNHKSLLTNEKKPLSELQIARNKVRQKYGTDFTGTTSLTEQQHKKSSNINTILDLYKNNPELLLNNQNNPNLYGDFSQASDYQTSLNIIIQADQQFSALPAHIREKFQNDPVKFLEYIESDKDGSRLVELGLATPKPKPSKTLDDVVESLEKHYPSFEDGDDPESLKSNPRTNKPKSKKSED